MADEKDTQLTEGQEWTAERAFADIIAAIDNPEDFSAQIDAVQSAFNVTNTGEDSYKERYERLRADYRRRFLGEMQEEPKPEVDIIKEEETDFEPLTVNDLDFDGLTE